MPDDAPKTKRRLQSATEREAESDRARRERDSASVTIPFADVGEDTGQVTALMDDEIERKAVLRALRSARPTPERIGKLEEKHDELKADVGEMKISLASIDGQLKVLPQLVQDSAAAAREAAAAANAIATAHRIATVTTTLETGGAAAVGGIETATAQTIDGIEKKKTRRELWLAAAKVIAGIAGGGGIVELLHQLGGK